MVEEATAETTATATPTLPDLVLSLEQTALMARQLPTTVDPTHLLQIYTSIHQAHLHLSTFLSNTQFVQPLPSAPPPPPPLPLQPPLTAVNSLSSSNEAAADDEGDEPMQVGDNEEDDDAEVEHNSLALIERVEEKMGDCFIKSKRLKRALSPAAVAMAERRRLFDDGFSGGSMGFDPLGMKLKALDLVYQFRG